MVDVAAKENAAVRRFKDDLSEFGELRNAIVHERVSPDYLIAVPLRETVERIEEIERVLANPPTVYPMFRRDVVVFAPDDKMEEVFRAMRSTGYTQFPVYRDGVYQGLLTDGGIAAWVARLIASQGDRAMSLSEIPVEEVLASQKNPQRARFVSRDTTLYEVEEMFRENSKAEKRQISAVLITHSGHPQEQLLGIVTPSDILSFPG
jgi:predicted transcriptional regulator